MPDKLDKAALMTLCGSRFSEALFEKNKDANGFVSKDVLLKLAKQTQCFLSHDWGTDALGRNNHERVHGINEGLKKRGIITWFDAEQMSGDIVDRMCEGIDNTSCVLVFVTANYMGKVGGSNVNDNCKREFGYAVRRKGSDRMLSIVMEPGMRNPGDWTGPVGMALGGVLYSDLADDKEEIMSGKLDDLAAQILKVCGLPPPPPPIALVKPPLKSEKVASATATAASPSAGTTTVAVLTDSTAKSKTALALTAWLEKVDLVAERVTGYCDLLIKHGISSAKRLAKKLEEAEDFLVEIGFHHDDAAEIKETIQQEFGATEDVEGENEEEEEEEDEEEEDSVYALEEDIPCGVCGESIFQVPFGTFGRDTYSLLFF